MPGSRSVVVTGLLALAAGLLTAVPALAAAPSNDDFDAATVVTSLPYSDTSSTLEATQAPDDPACGTGGSIWYAFTPSADTWIEVNTQGSDFDTELAAVTGARGSLDMIACNDDSQYGFPSAVVLRALAGTTYHFMVDMANGYNDPGTVVLNVQETTPPPPPLTSLTLTVNARDTVTHNGVVTLSGTAVCDQEGTGWVDLSVVQSNRRFSSRGSTETGFDCSPTGIAWSASFTSYTSAAFVPGNVPVSYAGYAYNATGDASTNGQATVTLVNAR